MKIAALTGTVDNLTLRATTLRDGDGTLYIIPNSQVATVANLLRDFAVADLSVSVDASADPDKVLRVLRAIALEVRRDPQLTGVTLADPDVPGIDKIAGREVMYPVSFRVRPNQRDRVLREMRRIRAESKVRVRPFSPSKRTVTAVPSIFCILPRSRFFTSRSGRLAVN